MSSPKTICFQVDGMHCRSCEVLLERAAKELPGVIGAQVSAKTGMAEIRVTGEADVDAESFARAIGNADYHVRLLREPQVPVQKTVQPNLPEIFFLFATVYVAGWLLGRLGLLSAGFDATSQVTVMGSFLIGLLAGTSSCLAVSGGLLLSTVAKLNTQFSRSSRAERMMPVGLFVAGRVVSYGIFGGLIGLIGKVLVPSAAITAALTLLAAAIMVVMGLQMLGLAPVWLMQALPRMPKFMSHGAFALEGKGGRLGPFFLGGATFFLPCGFTQSLQIYALTTGSAVTSGLILASFALGTAPMLLALGAASTTLKGKAGYWFFRFSGALVVTLGLLNLKNGAVLSGIALPSFSEAASTGDIADPNDPNVVYDGQTQVIAMSIGSDPFYSPTNHFTVKAGIPVRMEISGVGTGCRTVFQIPKAGVSLALTKPVNVVEFTPKKPGKLVFSCSMGMFPGSIDVI